MKVELFQDFVDEIGMFAVLVDPIEGVACSLYRQRWDVESLRPGRNGGNAGGDAEAEVAELTQLLYHRVYLLGVRSPRIENRLGVIKNYDHLL